MFGKHRRQSATATVVAGDLRHLHGEDMARWEFVVDVQPADGPLFRAEASGDFFQRNRIPQPGDVLTVSFDGKDSEDVRLELDGDARFDPHVVADADASRMAAARSGAAGTPIAASPQELGRAAQVAAMEYAVLRKGLEGAGEAAVVTLTGVREADRNFPPLVAYDLDATLPSGRPARFRVWVDPTLRPLTLGATVAVRIAPNDPTVVVLDHSA